MSKFDFILDNIVYSYSSASTFETCKFSFYLTYIQSKHRGVNFYGEYGSHMHDVLEKFFRKELDFFELSSYYSDHYNFAVKSNPPAFHKNAKEEYYKKGLDFFDSFSFDADLYDILVIEDGVNVKIKDFEIIAKPDLVLKNKETGKISLIDYKTANAYKNGKLDKTKVKGYMRQFLLYCWALWAGREIAVDEIEVWFITCGKIEKFPVDPMEVQENLEWFIGVIEKIKKEEKWDFNNSNSFFCNELCSVASDCPFRP